MASQIWRALTGAPYSVVFLNLLGQDILMLPINVLLLYAPNDRSFVLSLEKQLALLIKNGDISIWYEEKSNIGEDAKAQLSHYLNTARIIIPLISADLIASSMYEDIITPILTNSTALVLPVLVRPFDVEYSIFAKIACTPENGVPVSLWSNLDEAWHRVACSVRALVKQAQSTNDSLEKGQILPHRRSRISNPRHFGDESAIANILTKQKICNYEIINMIGEGGSGVVYRALDLRTKRMVCLKILYPLTGANLLLGRALERMKRALSSISQSGIVKILEFSPCLIEEKSTFYIAMSLIDGNSLEQWSFNLDADLNKNLRRMKILRNIALILHSAHSCKYIDDMGFEAVGILHGDIKPANIMVKAGDVPVVLDFLMLDIQRWLDLNGVPRDAFQSSILGTMSTVFGTVGFMAPEQEDKGIVTVQSDIYSLGCTIVRVFAPQKKEPDEWGDDVYSPSGRVDPLHYEFAVPEEMRELVAAMVKDNPADRPKSMKVVARKLDLIIDKHK